ncbi:MAG: metallophosphoesterase [Verrucomicrobiales bacterium]|nr:metallophosphoesterase [Verrucomicrobiales bacterium]
MPVSLYPKSRRSFLKTGSLATLSSAFALQAQDAAPWYALMSDTHIDADPMKEARGAVMGDNLRAVVDEILKEPTKPEFALINGDCAYLKGLKEDYATLRPLVQPLLDAGVPVHLTMGNHDDRGPFFELFPEANADAETVKDRHITVIESKDANWILIDTLQIVNNVTGEIGQEQREWISATIDDLGDKPVILVGHHYLQPMPEGATERISGLADTAEFMGILESKPQIKAYIYGHSHSYGFKEVSGGIHLINQPPVAYVFNQSRPNGWLRAELSGDSLSLKLNTLDKAHELSGDTKMLSWR